ncbi:DUF192 domain-containing protein [Candidatus Woesearchaeota archaeon]|nr:DUF192 domain-containing protein [Candidatus Woesearchaeota archaeon]
MIINQTKKKIISQKEIVCKTLSSQIRGLMFRKKQNLVMIFKEERPISLHNFFVFFPLEIVLLNKNNRVIEIKLKFLPFTLWNSDKKAKVLLEIAEKNSKNLISVGDKIILKS